VLIRVGTARLGESVVIREATAEDARSIINILRTSLQEPDNNLSQSLDDVDITEQEQQQYIKNLTGNTNELMLVAEVISQSAIVGVLTCQGKPQKTRRHVVQMQVTVQKGWRGKGIGTRLIQQSIHWAKRHKHIRRIELYVLARNTKAVSLYSRLGFRVEGRGTGAIYKNGKYLDNYWMAVSTIEERKTS
jgi:hypothetical protein